MLRRNSNWADFLAVKNPAITQSEFTNMSIEHFGNFEENFFLGIVENREKEG